MLLVFRFVDIDAVFGGAEPVVRPADSGGILFVDSGAIHKRHLRDSWARKFAESPSQFPVGYDILRFNSIPLWR